VSYDSQVTEAILDGTVAYIRLLIGDPPSDEPLPEGAPGPIFTNEELATLSVRGGGPLWGAADALDAIATTEVLLSKKLQTKDLSTDGPAVAAELRKQATALRIRAKADLARVTEEAWGIASWSTAPRRDRIEAVERIEHYR
jgi:hypothetical protein